MTKLKFTRKFLKKIIMTIPYNIGISGIRDNLIEYFDTIIIKVQDVIDNSGNWNKDINEELIINWIKDKVNVIISENSKKEIKRLKSKVNEDNTSLLKNNNVNNIKKQDKAISNIVLYFINLLI